MFASSNEHLVSRSGAVTGMMDTFRLLLVALAIMAASLPAAAQSSKTFSAFICEINLKENGLDKRCANSGLPDSECVKGGIVYTFNTNKLCTGEASNVNIKLDCSVQISGWTGGSVNMPVLCSIGGAACDVSRPSTGGVLKDTTNNRLTVDASGLANLSCQWKGPKVLTP